MPRHGGLALIPEEPNTLQIPYVPQPICRIPYTIVIVIIIIIIMIMIMIITITIAFIIIIMIL